MSNQIQKQYEEQIEKIVGGPARAFVGLALNHIESVADAQYEAARNYTDIGVRQFRAALDIRSPQDLQAYVQGQQEVAREIGERVKGDAEKFVALNQEFVQRARSLSEENVKNVSKVAQGTARKAAKATAA